MFAQFNRFEIQMTKKEAQSVSHSGDCENDVIALIQMPKFERQLRKIRNEDLILELKEYGAWDEIELQNRIQNERRIIWIAGNNIIEELHYSSKNN